MNTTALIFQLIGGGTAGYAAGHFVKVVNLGGAVGNAAVGRWAAASSGRSCLRCSG
jgi:hypothetical protein